MKAGNKRRNYVVAIVLGGGLALAGYWLWTTPLAPIPSKAVIGKLNLEVQGAELQVRFKPPKELTGITLVITNLVPGSQEFSARPDFPLVVHLRVTEVGGTNVIDEVIPSEKMSWTNWHRDPSIWLRRHGWLGDRLSREREYDLRLSVGSPVAGLGHAEVFLHWMDGGYVWGRETQKLQLTSGSEEPEP
jgi:hypothetical protein